MGMAPRVMSRCGSCPRPLPGSCSLIRTMGGQSSLCVPPWEGGEVCVVSVSVCLPECDQCARLALIATRVPKTGAGLSCDMACALQVI